MSSKNYVSPYVIKANQYIDDVLTNKIPASKWTKLSLERQKNDLERSLNDPEYPFYFDHVEAERICKFAEMCPVVSGGVSTFFKLEPWQCFLYTCVFGWVYKETGKRRFKTVYTEVAKKNGKSFTTSPVGLYMLSCDNEEGAQVYVAASQREQTKYVFDGSMEIVKKSPKMAQGLGIDYTKNSIFQKSSGSYFQRLTKDSMGSLDGMNPHCAIIDELHAHKNRDTFDAITSSIGARDQPLLWIITTAGKNRSSVCYEQHSYLKKILLGQHQDESFFGCIYTIDDNDDITDPEVWKKANPNLGVSIKMQAFKELCNKAQGSSSALNNFLTKNLNVWVNADSAWMNMFAWDKCADEDLDIDDFKNDPCFIGCDLAAKKDFASVSKVFVRKKDNKKHYYVFVDHFQNRRAMEESTVDMLEGWEEDGYIHVNEGNITSFEAIRDHIVEINKNFDVKNIAFDPREATDLREQLKNLKIETEEYYQNLGTMSEPTLELESLVLDGRFHFDGDPVLSWMISNVIGHMNHKEQIYPKRDMNQRDQKIDGAIATIIAIGSEMKHTDKNIQPQMFFFKRK